MNPMLLEIAAETQFDIKLDSLSESLCAITQSMQSIQKRSTVNNIPEYTYVTALSARTSS